MRPPVDLERRERVLTQAPTRGGSHVVATTTALHIPKVEGGFLRIPWDHIDQASWKNNHLHLKTSTTEHHVGLTDPGSVPETVRERVTATIAFSHQAKLPHGGGVRIAGRRPATGGDIRWTFVFDAGLDPSDPGLRAQAEQLLEDLRRQTGL